MTKAVVSFTHLTMGKLFLRTADPERMASLPAATGDALMSHWTLREATGALMIDVHADEASFRQDFTRSSAMFADRLHRFHVDSYSFTDDAHEAAVLDALSTARAVGAAGEAADPAAPDENLKGRLVSFNHIPRLPGEQRARVHEALDAHDFGSVIHLVVQTPQGELLIDPYLDEPTLMDDFVFVHDLLAEASVEVLNHWHPFTDRFHERALDELAVGLGKLTT